MTSAFDTEEAKALYKALVMVDTTSEARDFIADLCTPKEVKDLSERWEIAKLLDEGTLSYREISAQTGASTTTVARVARFLKNEPHQGYARMISKIKKSS